MNIHLRHVARPNPIVPAGSALGRHLAGGDPPGHGRLVDADATSCLGGSDATLASAHGEAPLCNELRGLYVGQEQDGSPVKRCGMCGEEKPVECFSRRSAAWDGLQARCKVCMSAYWEKWHEKNHEAYLAQKMTHYEENRDALRAKGRAYYESVGRDQYIANRESVLERGARWQKAHPDACAAHARAYYARKLGVPGRYTEEDVAAQLARQKGRCFYCKTKVGNEHQADHVIPLAGERESSNGRENIVVSCPRCNRRKNKKDPMDFAGILF